MHNLHLQICIIDTDKYVVLPRYTVCLLILVVKFEMSHALQSNINKNYGGYCDLLSVSILALDLDCM